MLKKCRSKEKSVIRVTFVLPAEMKAETAQLVGEFNDWQTSHGMQRQRDGT